MMNATQGNSSIAIGGHRTSGQQVRDQNVTAISAIANIMKSSLGPVGLDKMLVDDIGDVTISNDGATIMGLLEVKHPAAQILVELAREQDEQVGDGTTSVVLIAAELLVRANELVKRKIHPTNIITGYRLACREACKFIRTQMSISVDTLGKECLINCAKTTLDSKIIGGSGENAAFFAQMAVDAVLAVKRTNSFGKASYPVGNIRILKSHGGSQAESQLIHGYALNCTVASQAMTKTVTGAKIACLNMNLQKTRMHMGVSIELKDPSKIEAIRARESTLITERIERILGAGANVLLTTGGIDDLCLKPFVERGAMAVRRCTHGDLVKIAAATGATLISSLANLEGGESFDSSLLGTAKSVEQQRFGDQECIIVNGCYKDNAASVILRGANSMMLDEMERALHDALCTVKRTLEGEQMVVPGGGAVECALALFLDTFAASIASREQLAISAFANALLIIPRTLAMNSGKDAMDLTAALTHEHHRALTATADDVRDRDRKWMGLDLTSPASSSKGPGTKSGVRDSIAAGCLEPAMSKVRALKSACEAAISILRIDDMMTIDPPPAQGEDDCQ